VLLVLIAGGIIYLFYWIPKRLGYPTAGRILATVITLSLCITVALNVFDDELFSKNDAEELLAEQDLKLTDNFEILENKSMAGIGDYYHTFTLRVSEKDKKTIIGKIKSSSNFTVVKEMESARYSDNPYDYYSGPKRIKNYETETQFVRELFEPKGQGYAPTFRKIEIEKAENKLIFEDIDE
jgi:hypothetical protein